MANEYKGKVALVTGGGSGIGRATALQFGSLGAKVVTADINEASAQATAKAIVDAGGEATATLVDVADGKSVEAMVAFAVATYGQLDCAFNNAGIEGEGGSVVDCTEENWARTIAIDLTGVWLSMKHEIPAMLASGGGTIVNTASVAGLSGTPGLPAYGAAKHGVVGLTKGAAKEYAARGIRVNAVCPGVIETPMVDRLAAERAETREAFNQMHPIGRTGQPEEIAEAVIWLCSPASSFVTGHAMAIDGGLLSAWT
ncbi:MAG: glucose 1-dehydrogenase [Immundisolibacteraceae bacterium]|nr:glucose 1-dehydrogenase [Immundisolibacteraceae bacterium]